MLNLGRIFVYLFTRQRSPYAARTVAKYTIMYSFYILNLILTYHIVMSVYF